MDSELSEMYNLPVTRIAYHISLVYSCVMIRFIYKLRCYSNDTKRRPSV